ncbi:hypothetical protein TRFO_26583 [Tritrichomonas foetus]|uniref:VPS9 domain-containing protein n=1 Tax=Tritrichomonas foetus TaxID=1144522 RepID=A0A1J4K314_9EUKA|nr:hypothetical protein TRFO_26583 [Tritrichomonas foetus]|eukprot:OHT05587.1 hypothetical protein TRFO_26583 [Tritrichomonas foetus]
MSILFEETKQPRKKIKSCNNLSKLQSNFSSSGEAASPGDSAHNKHESDQIDLFALAPTKKGLKNSGKLIAQKKSGNSEDKNDLLFGGKSTPAKKKNILFSDTPKTLFDDEDDNKPVALPRKPLSQNAPKNRSNEIDLFGDSSNIKPKVPPTNELQLFYDENVNIHKYALLTPVFDTDLNEQQKIDRIVRSANSNTVIMSNFARRIVFQLEQLDNEHQKLESQIMTLGVPIGAPFKLRGLYSLKHNNTLKVNELMANHIKRTQNLVQYIGKLLDIASNNPKDREVKLNHQLLESELNDYSKETKLQLVNKLQRTVKTKIKQEKKEILSSTEKLSKITKLCASMFREEEHFFPDFGEAESLFATVIEQMTGPQREYIEKSIVELTNKPNLSGKILFAVASNFLNIHNIHTDNLQYYFLLFARYFFSRVFIMGNLTLPIIPKISNSNKTNDTESLENFVMKVKLILKHSPVALGCQENFLPNKYKTMALQVFPKDNPYKDAIDIFSSLPYYTCPIDFCRAMHEGLKVVQNIASEISFKEKYEATGKVYAKSDHLLCLDDLFDITMITMLIANPIPVYQLVEAFQPYIGGLQMTSELEFAFTNVHALMQHISSINVEKFTKDAKLRLEESMETDPLNILGKK